jgi:predicted enzyme related to lactoylglutathione lyase
MKNNTISYIEFKTTDLQKTKDFFTKVFNWEFKDFAPTYAEIIHAGLEGGFEEVDEVLDGGTLAVLYHNDLESIRKTIVDSGGEIIVDIFEFPGGRRFSFSDGYAQEIAIWTKI